mmetsp:Transcript_70966/g.148457  ORF Transcript_70966/g.148457 Transcript_70966/m.148457 type:complete len:213 (-) Transcript_70966:83-721(-)
MESVYAEGLLYIEEVKDLPVCLSRATLHDPPTPVKDDVHSGCFAATGSASEPLRERSEASKTTRTTTSVAELVRVPQDEVFANEARDAALMEASRGSNSGAYPRNMDNDRAEPSQPDLPPTQPRPSLRTLAKEAKARGEVLASIGAVLHESGRCSPCIFRSECPKGYQCTYCHEAHQDDASKRKVRPSKRVRELMRHRSSGSLAQKDSDGTG